MSSVAKANDPSVRVRFPRKILRELDQAAAKNGRSRNSEIVQRLQQSLQSVSDTAHSVAAGA